MPAGSAFNTLAEVKDFIAIQDTDVDADRDATLGWLSDAAAEAITAFAGREFAPTASASRIFDYDGCGYLRLAPWDLRSVTSITGPTGSAIDTASYRLLPRNPRFETYEAIELPRSGKGDVTIAGAWGFASVPPQVKAAHLMQVRAWYFSQATDYSRQFIQGLEGESGSWRGGDALVPTVKKLLGSLRRGLTS